MTFSATSFILGGSLKFGIRLGLVKRHDPNQLFFYMHIWKRRCVWYMRSHILPRKKYTNIRLFNIKCFQHGCVFFFVFVQFYRKVSLLSYIEMVCTNIKWAFLWKQLSHNGYYIAMNFPYSATINPVNILLWVQFLDFTSYSFLYLIRNDQIVIHYCSIR